MEIRKIAFNIYASSDEEAEKGRKAITQFIDIMGQHGAMVSGRKLHEAIGHIGDNSFIMSQIINFFKK
jgi:ribulose-5-phosphate 4-epimerase/fuculose-1-phosphate aldolase